MSAAPVLLAVNLRKEWVNPETDAPWLRHAQNALFLARAAGWKIIHCHRARTLAVAPQGAPLGLEPLASEPVHAFFCNSPLDHLPIRAALGGAPTYVIGAARARTGLGAVLTAQEDGRRLIFISEACGAGYGATAQIAREAIRLAEIIPIELAFAEAQDNVVALSTWRAGVERK